ncbi:MFS transporter [Massilia sp. CT11-137]|uniref:MFS transporter n=1 Tax=Massilia sp. CT11-137 TaxID=3393901 RepID=UPI0039AFEDDF
MSNRQAVAVATTAYGGSMQCSYLVTLPAITMHQNQTAPLTMLAMVASTLIYALSVVPISVSPIMAGLFADHLDLSVSEVGWILSIEQAGCVFGALFAFWATSRVQWRSLIILASVVAILANAVTGSMTGFAAVAMTRFIAGIASNTVTLVASCLLARAAEPDRAFGAGLLVSCVINAMWVWLLNTAQQTLGYQATIGLGTLLFVVSMMLAFFLPRRVGGVQDTWRIEAHAAPLALTNPRPARAGLAGLVLFGISLNVVWGFLERLGTANGLSGNDIAWALGIGLLGSGLGALAPTLLGDAGNRVRMLFITTVVLFASLGLTWCSHGVVMFTLSVSLLAGAWNMGLAYYMAQTSTNDACGRYTRAIYIAIAASQSIGPGLAAILLGHFSLMSVLVVSPLPAVIALVFVTVVRRTTESSSTLQKVVKTQDGAW